MKLLIITQVIDTEHPVLGFFHRWVEEFAKHCKEVHVICLEAGKQSLPANVTVHSLGKEDYLWKRCDLKEEERRGRSFLEEQILKIKYTFRFYKYIWRLRKEYDQVFVHMNQEYVLLAGLIWKISGRPVEMWRNHYSGTWLTRLAGWLCQTVYYTSNASYTATFSNSKQMPIGIDPELFKVQPVERRVDSLLYVGRIASSKRIHLILEALDEARINKPNLTLTIVGGVVDEAGALYKRQLEQIVSEKSLPVTFTGPVAWQQLPEIYSTHELCINLSPPGMFDKVIGEALLCGCDVVTTNLDLERVLGSRTLKTAEVKDLSKFFVSHEYNQDDVSLLKQVVTKEHSLPTLVEKVINRS